MIRMIACSIWVAACVPASSQTTKDPKTAAQASDAVDLTQPLTLERALQIGLRQEYSLRISKSQLDSSRARVTQSRSSYYPQVAPTYDYTARKLNGSSRTSEQGVAFIGLQQLIFDTGKREANVAASEYSAKAAEYNVLDTRQAVIANITTAFYNYLRTRELVKVAESSVERTRTELDATTAFAEVGSSPKKDIFQADSDYQNAQVQLIQARNDVNLAQTTLRSAMGLLSIQQLNIPEQQLSVPAAEPDKRGVADYLKLALDKRPDLHRAEAFIDSDRHQVKVANINAGVQVQANVSEGYQIDPNPGEDRTFAVSFSYPLFDAGASRAAVREARATLEQSRLQLDQTRQAIQTGVEQSSLTREEARARIAATSKALNAAQVNYDAARESQKEGAGTIIDVITAQTLLVTAETNSVQAIFDYYTADAQLQRAIGANDPFLIGGKK